MQYREALLPGTDALPRQTVEWKGYFGKHLVRYRTQSGSIFRVQTADREEADARFWSFVERLRQEVKASRGM